MSDQYTRQDPTTQYQQPQYPEQDQRDQHPGAEQQMQPKPDHGEETYKGSGRLTGKKAVITGGDSGIGKAVALAFAREGADVLISTSTRRKTPRRRRASSKTLEGRPSRSPPTSPKRPSARV